VAKAKASDDQAVIAHQQLQIVTLTRQLYDQRSERTVRLLDQMELALVGLESSATEDEIAAERALAKTTNVVAFTRKRPARQPIPEHLLRERVVEPDPTVLPLLRQRAAAQVGRGRHRDAPRQWKVIQHVCEKFTCRDCEKISFAQLHGDDAPQTTAQPLPRPTPNRCAFVRIGRQGDKIAIRWALSLVQAARRG
jgi:transposase